MVAASVAREMWQLLEPYHAVVYFHHDARAIYESVGLKGYWMGYFASRSAAMGSVDPEIVIATFYNFSPGMVERAIPDAWKFSSPKVVLEARLRVADAALRRALGDQIVADSVNRAAEIARDVALACHAPGRPLFAAHATLPWPEQPHMTLWHAATLWREFRGDGHVATLLVNGIDGCEAHVLASGAGVVPERQHEYRGWSMQEWAEAGTRLRRRGLVDNNGELTDDGWALRQRIEDATDKLSLPPLVAVGDERVEELKSLLTPLAVQIKESKVLPYPNAVGVPPPVV